MLNTPQPPEDKAMEFVNCSKHNLASDYSNCKKCHWKVTPEEAKIQNDVRSQLLDNMEGIL